MANNTYSWVFPALDVTKSQGSYTDIVYNVHWRLRGVDQSASHSAEIYGVQSVAPYNPDSGSFIPFENLTETIVEGWVKDAMGDTYNVHISRIDAEIEEQVNPKTEQLPPPWASGSI
jgi:hypothetical protein